jgi:hypothetical protein
LLWGNLFKTKKQKNPRKSKAKKALKKNAGLWKDLGNQAKKTNSFLKPKRKKRFRLPLESSVKKDFAAVLKTKQSLLMALF